MSESFTERALHAAAFSQYDEVARHGLRTFWKAFGKRTLMSSVLALTGITQVALTVAGIGAVVALVGAPIVNARLA